MIVADMEIEPAIGMELVKKRSGSIYRISEVLDDKVRLIPKWSGRNSRSIWKTRTHLRNDYRIYLGGVDGAN